MMAHKLSKNVEMQTHHLGFKQHFIIDSSDWSWLNSRRLEEWNIYVFIP